MITLECFDVELWKFEDNIDTVREYLLKSSTLGTVRPRARLMKMKDEINHGYSKYSLKEDASLLSRLSGILESACKFCVSVA